MGKAAKPKPKASPKKAAALPKKQPPVSESPLLRRTLFLLGAMGLVGAIMIGWRNWVWERVGPLVKSSQEYRLDPSGIEVQPTPPAWIRGNIREEVLRNVALSKPLSMLDEKLPERIADAFEFHPWVAEAKVTLKYPARVLVELKYRQPVAQLLVENRAGEEQVVLDTTGKRLPETDLTAKEIARLPVVTDSTGVHVPLIGQLIESPRVRGGVEIAAVVAHLWPELNLVRINPLTVLQGEGVSRYQAFELQGSAGESYLWGASPSEAPADETTAAVKLQRLQEAWKLAREGQGSTQLRFDLRNSQSGASSKN